MTIQSTSSLVFATGTSPQSIRSGIANLSDALLNLVHQETQSNRLSEQVQPSATYWQFSARLRWPKIFEGMVMTVLFQLRSQSSSDFRWQFTRRAADTTFCRCFFFMFELFTMPLLRLSRHLRYYYWPIRCRFHFSHSWAMEKVKSAFD